MGGQRACCQAVNSSGAYYRDVLLSQHVLPAIKEMSADCFTFQQDRAPAHRARETVALLTRETRDFIPPTLWPPNSPDLNPVDYKIWSVLQERVYRSRIRDVNHLRERGCWRNGVALIRASSTRLSNSGVCV